MLGETGKRKSLFQGLNTDLSTGGSISLVKGRMERRGTPVHWSTTGYLTLPSGTCTIVRHSTFCLPHRR